MGIHLYKQGKRKCYICKTVYPLNKEYFYTSNNKSSNGFRFECNTCNKKITPKHTYDYRSLFVKYAGHKCAKCGIEHEDKSFFDVDHINPIKIGVRTWKERVFLKKDYHLYQLLCPNCHRIKTIEDNKK